MKILIAALLIFLLIGKIQATEYFVNSVTGNDANPGTSANAPWKSLTPLNEAIFLPGDIINFACNLSWTKSYWDQQKPMLLIDDSGNAEQPII